SYFGCTVGRFCNRIAQGKFSIDGTEFSLATNNGENHLHGGKDGWDKKVWKAEKLLDGNSVGIRFSVTSPEGDEGYPGEVQATVDYILDDDNQLKIIFSAKSNAKTHINLTNHCYWNLGGTGSGTILDHILQVNADHYLPVDETGIPTGEIAKTEATPFDFSKPTPIGSRIDQISGDPGGYDHNFVISEESSEEPLRLAATVSCPESGRKMEVLTTQPGIQFYTGNYLNGQPGSGGFEKHHGFCLETQHYPDSPNQTKFPSTLLEPGQEYRQTTIHRFSVQK
ncbi:MAG: aldose epimerase family protein, partial [Planctomycetota bacterium]